jgi:hypothetical protein
MESRERNRSDVNRMAFAMKTHRPLPENRGCTSQWAFGCLFLSLVLAGVLRAGPIDVENPPQGRFSDEWAEIFIGGAKSGYAHSTMARSGDEIQTETTMKLRIGRAGQNIDLSVSQQSVETVAGRPLRFSSVMDMSLMKTSTRGTIADGRVTLVSSQYGMEQTQSFDYPKDAIMTWGAFREGVRRGFKPGTKYTLPMYAPDLRLDGSVDATTAIGDWETFTHRGRQIRGQKVTLTLESPLGSLEMLSWVDENGSPRKAMVPIPGLADLEIVTTDQKTAVSEFVPPEIFMTTVIRSPRPLFRERVNRIRYRLTNRDEKAEAPDLPATDMQKILGKEGRSIELEVRRLPRGRAERASPDKLPSGMSEFLDANLILNTADPVLVELAGKAAGDETDAFALADRLRRFVTDFVSNKSMNVGFATASEVARSREGDCSEHGVLLAALGRLNGLPSRVVVGLAYAPFFGGENDIFGYHLWTQFFIDGKWYDYDAALRESDVSPARIAFAASSLKNAGLAELSFGMLSTIGDLSLEFLDVESAAGKD